MVESPRRIISAPIKSDPWRYQTVQGHISTPVTPRRASARSNQDITIRNHITPSQTLRERKRHRNPSPSSPHHAVRRRVEPAFPIPARSLIGDYNKRKAATAHFPPKITPQHIRAAMRRYEQVVQDACAGVETSCASCGEFMAKADSQLIPVDDDRLRSMIPPEGVIQLDNCSIMDGSYQFCKGCFNALDGGRIPKFRSSLL